MDTKATIQAEHLLKELGVNNFPVDPFKIANEYKIAVQEMPSSQGGVSGAIFKVKDNFGILYAAHIENKGFQRFSICHELGHYFLPEHPEIVLSTTGMHSSTAGFNSSQFHEVEADNFASGLLMPKFLFDRQLEKVDIGLGGIIQLSEICITSITSTAIRYAQRNPDPVAIIVSIGSRVDYCFMSDELKEYPNLSWVKKGSLIPQYTKTYEFNKDGNNVRSARQDSGLVELSTWFGGSIDGELCEEVIGLGSYGKTLTVLTASNIPDLDEIEEEEQLEASWKICFRK